MKTKLKNTGLFPLIFTLALISCHKEKAFLPQPPFEKLNPVFVEIMVNNQKDSLYTLENGTRIQITAGSLINLQGEPISNPIKLTYRQFDDATGIFLAGMPMSFGKNKALATAGMFEIRGYYNNEEVQVNPDKPIKITIGSNFTDTRQGFFKLNETTGNWELNDIPEWKYNTKADSLKNKIKNLKPEFFLPLGPKFYVFDFTRMADIFIGEENYDKIYNANLKAMAAKMKSYGVTSLEINQRFPRVKYKGNMYDMSEILWKSDEKIKVPSWVKTMDGYYYDEKNKTYVDCISEKSSGANMHEFSFLNHKTGNKFILRLEAVCHLRYLLRYSPEQLMAKQQNIEKEIEEAERKLRQARLIEYTVEVYSMGVYNCDRPILYSPARPQLAFTIDGVPIDETEIKKVAVFNQDLSSVSYPVHYKPVVCPFFKGTNRLLLVSTDGKVGLLTGEEFDKLLNQEKMNQENLVLNLKMVSIDDEASLKNILQN